MSDLLPFIVAGLTTGAVYGLAGLGLVLTYKTSGIFNFAHGALATVAAFVFYVLHVEHGLPWGAAAAVSVLVVGPLMGLLMELVGRRIGPRTLAAQVSSTVGLLLAVEAVTQLIFTGSDVRTVPVFLAKGSFTLGGTQVQWSDVATLVVAVALTVAVSLLFRFSRVGTEMRAVVDDPALLGLSGTSPTATRRTAWVLGSVLASASGVLFAPLLPLDPLQLTLLVVAAFGAAAVGAFRNLPVTFGGGLLVGLLASVSTKYLTSGVLGGVPASMPFIVLFVVLLVFPKRKLAALRPVVSRAQRPGLLVGPAQGVLAITAVVVLALVPTFASTHLSAWTTSVATLIVFMSLGLLVRVSGQVSLCHVAFTAIGAASFSHLVVQHHVPWLIALVCAGLVAVPIGAVLAIPAIRLNGLYLALTTFGFGILLQSMFYTQGYFFGGNGLGLIEPRPGVDWLHTSSDKGYYYLVVVIVVVLAGFVVALTRTRLGRLARGMSDSSTALATSGATVDVTRVLMFCIASFLAAVGGALAAVGQQTVSADSYQPFTSLIYLVVVVTFAAEQLWGAALSSAALILVPSYVSGADTPTYLQLVFGLAALGLALAPEGVLRVPGPLRRLLVRDHERPPAIAAGVVPRRTAASGTLEVTGIRVQFGGIVAVDGVGLTARPGRVTGLVGPNGAGKTTTFNACSGLVRPRAGAIMLGGRDVTRRSPASRARRGLGRTFQRMELFDSMTVRENVELGVEAGLAGADPLWHVVSRPGQRRAVRRAAADALQLCGISEIAEEPSATLSTGQRRLVELARCLAGEHSILLLDEPSSGLDRSETAAFGRVLQDVVAERGLGVLLVEHDMSLVLEICDEVFVLDYGKPIFHGTPSEMSQSPLVHAAYLGALDLTELPVEPVQGAMW